MLAAAILCALGAAASMFFILLGTALIQSKRALKEPPTGWKHGMYIDKDGKLVATKTAIHHDPKSGEWYYGKTVKEN